MKKIVSCIFHTFSILLLFNLIFFANVFAQKDVEPPKGTPEWYRWDMERTKKDHDKNLGKGIYQKSISSRSVEDKFQECRGKLIQAQKLNLLYDLDWKPPKEPRVLVGPTFFRIPIDAKEEFVLTINCFLMAGDEGKVVNFDILDWRNGKRVGRFSYGKLKID